MKRKIREVDASDILGKRIYIPGKGKVLYHTGPLKTDGKIFYIGDNGRRTKINDGDIVLLSIGRDEEEFRLKYPK